MTHLEEVANLKWFLQNLGVTGEKHDSGDAEKKAKTLVESLLREHHLDYHVEKQKTKEGLLLEHHFKVFGVKYTVKTYLLTEDAHVISSIWTEHDNLEQVLCVGYLKDYYSLLGFAKGRMKGWYGTKSDHR